MSHHNKYQNLIKHIIFHQAKIVLLILFIVLNKNLENYLPKRISLKLMRINVENSQISWAISIKFNKFLLRTISLKQIIIIYGAYKCREFTNFRRNIYKIKRETIFTRMTINYNCLNVKYLFYKHFETHNSQNIN